MAVCDLCLGCKRVTPDGVPESVIKDKDGKRPAWEGLLARSVFIDCPNCKGSGSKGPGRPVVRKKKRSSKRAFVK